LPQAPRAQQARDKQGVGACVCVPACMHELWARACVCEACPLCTANTAPILRLPQVHAAVGAVCLNLSAASARPLPYGQRDACPCCPAHATADALPMRRNAPAALSGDMRTQSTDDRTQPFRAAQSGRRRPVSDVHRRQAIVESGLAGQREVARCNVARCVARTGRQRRLLHCLSG
jgi:hypothetical protein